MVRIPLINRSKPLIPENKPFISREQKVFHVLTDQPTNRYLKRIMKHSEIDKLISFDCSRHTFATNGLSLGIPLEVIKSLLGHTDIKTNLIYAKLEDSVRTREI